MIPNLSSNLGIVFMLHNIVVTEIPKCPNLTFFFFFIIGRPVKSSSEYNWFKEKLLFIVL